MAIRKTYLKDLFFVAIDTPEIEQLQLQYSPPSISYSREADIQDIAIVGRNDKLHQYTSGTTNLSFEVDFYSQQADRQDVKAKVKWLESQLYSSENRAPSRILIVFGDLFKDEVWIMKSCSVTYTNLEPATGWLPLYAKASLSFVRDTEQDLFATNIINQNF